MNLLIIRHAEAEGFAMDDSARSLTESGREQARRVGGFLKEKRLIPDITITSPFVRASQTAELFCEAAGLGSPVSETWLACGMRPSVAIKELVAYQDFNTVALCGHNPDFAELTQWLLGSQAGGIHVSNASVIYFSNLKPPQQGAYLEMIVPLFP